MTEIRTERVLFTEYGFLITIRRVASVVYRV
jgi:hypothetical protein